MKIGIIGPSKLKSVEDVNSKARKLIEGLAKVVAQNLDEIVIVPDKGSASEFFGLEYLKHKGKKVYEIVPLEDKEFGFSWINLELGEHINCGTWRNQPEKLNEETDCFLCIGYAVGVLAEIAYSKWFNPKPVYIVRELISGKLPIEVERSLNLKYISAEELKNILRKNI